MKEVGVCYLLTIKFWKNDLMLVLLLVLQTKLRNVEGLILLRICGKVEIRWA